MKHNACDEINYCRKCYFIAKRLDKHAVQNASSRSISVLKKRWICLLGNNNACSRINFYYVDNERIKCHKIIRSETLTGVTRKWDLAAKWQISWTACKKLKKLCKNGMTEYDCNSSRLLICMLTWILDGHWVDYACAQKMNLNFQKGQSSQWLQLLGLRSKFL